MLHIFTNGLTDLQRVRHVLRLSIGTTLVTFFGLIPSFASGCLTAVLFLLSTTAGTSEYHVGFQLRSADLALLGSVLAFISSTIVHLIANDNPVAVVFAIVPFILLFSFLRPDGKLVPLPAVANGLMGFLVISGFGKGRTEALVMWKRGMTEACIAWVTAYAVNALIIPDYAMDEGRALLGFELRRIGAALSRAASLIVNLKKVEDVDKERMKVTEKSADMHGMKDRVFGDNSCLNQSKDLDDAMRLYMEGLHTPIKAFGFAILDDIYKIRRVRELLKVGCREPRMMNGYFSGNRWLYWNILVGKTEEMLKKVSALQSVAYLADVHDSNFSPNSFRNFVGARAIHLWAQFYGRMAAACNVFASYADISERRRLFTQFTVQHMKEFDIRNFAIDKELDARHWGCMRQQMYHHAFLQFQLYWRKVGGFDTGDVKGDTLTSVPFRDTRPGVGEVRATLFVLDITHSISEALSDVSKAFEAVSGAYTKCSPFAPCRGMYQSLSHIAERLRTVFQCRLKRWELRFLLIHSLLLWAILSTALLIPGLRNIETGEVGWAFLSAAFVTQLTAEPTAFIGVLRVTATFVGCGVGYCFFVLLHKIGTGLPTDYLLLPFMALNTALALLFVKSRFRYASFLYLVTIVVITICPRNDAGCSSVTLPGCSPDWKYAIARAINTAIGVVLAMLFHFIFWPRFARVEARHELCSGLDNASRLYRSLFHRYFSIGLHGQQPASPVALGEPLEFDLKKAESDPSLYTEVYSAQSEVVGALDAKVAKYINKAYELIMKQGSLWMSGPLATPRVLSDFLSHFHKLNVSITEMASTLRRRPAMTGKYSRSAHILYVDPFLFSYETAFISLRNVSLATQRAILYPTDSSLRAAEVISDLEVAISHVQEALRVTQAHYAKARRDAHRILEYRGRHRHEPDVDLEKLLNELLSECYVDKKTIKCLIEKSVAYDENVLARVQDDPALIRSDDSVLFFSLIFSANACINAFLCIARSSLTDMKRIVQSEQKRKWWKPRQAHLDDLEMSLLNRERLSDGRQECYEV